MPSLAVGFYTIRLWIGAALVAAIAVFGLYHSPAAAQQAGAPEETAQPRSPTDVLIVSARRRDESALDVPVAVSSFSGQDLIELGAPDITYLNQAIPNVTLERSRATNSTLTAFIRGVGQQDPVAGFEQGVGMYLDDIYLNRPQGAVLDIFDVERIEVLRGPQGTLYGRNTIGGAVKFVTRRLNMEEPEARIRVSGGTYGQFDVTATFSTPVVKDKVTIGGGIARYARKGYGDNLFNPDFQNYDKNVIAGRLTLEFTPTEDLFIRISGDWTEDDSDPRHGHRLLPSGVLPSGAGPFPVLDDVFDTQSNLTAPKPLVRNRGISLLIEWDVTDQITLKNILAYRDNESAQQIDFDSLPVSDLESPFVLQDDQLSEEFQVLYQDDVISGLLGFYYLRANAFNEFDVILGETGLLIGSPGLNAFTLGDVKTRTWSIFGDFTIDLAEAFGWHGEGLSGLELSIGGRYTEDKRIGRVLRQTYVGGNSPTFGGTGILVATTSDFLGERKDTDFTPKISLSYKPADNHTLYFSFSQGFKGGGFDPRAQTTGAPDINQDGMVSQEEIFEFMTFEPENITTYEVGWKAQAFDNRLNFSLVGFYSDYKNVQIPGSLGVDTNGDGVSDDFTGVTTNAGKARLYGIEFEGGALVAEGLFGPGDDLTANWAVGWIDAKYTEFFVQGVNVADQRAIQNTPEWTLNLRLNYSHPLTVFGEEGTISLLPSVSYRSFTQQFEFASPLDQPGYALVDVSLVWTSDNGTWELGVHGRNLTDKEYKVAGYDFVNVAAPLGLSGVLTAFYGDPLTVTVTAGVRF